MILKKSFLKLINNSVFSKTLENVRKHRDINVATTEKRASYFVSEQSYHTYQVFHRKSVDNRNEKSSNISE